MNCRTCVWGDMYLYVYGTVRMYAFVFMEREGESCLYQVSHEMCMDLLPTMVDLRWELCIEEVCAKLHV